MHHPLKETTVGYSFRTTKQFWKRKDLSLQAKGIAMILLCYSDRHCKAFPTTPQIAKDARCGPETVDRYLSELRKAGVVSWSIWKDEHGQKRRMFDLTAIAQRRSKYFDKEPEWIGVERHLIIAHAIKGANGQSLGGKIPPSPRG